MSATRISIVEEAVLGAAFLGCWVRSLEYREHYGRDGGGVFGTSSKAVKSERGSVHFGGLRRTLVQQETYVL